MPQTAETKLDPFALTTQDGGKFRSLDFFDQIDVLVNTASKPNVAGVKAFIAYMVWWCVHAACCLFATWFISGAELWSLPYHETLLKNVIAWDAIANHHGVHSPMTIRNRLAFGAKFRRGSVKESFFPSVLGRRRTALDVAIHIAFDASRAWLFFSAQPSSACAWCVFATALALYLFDFGEYVGAYGMYHGPWSVFILAKYAGFGEGPATAMMQFLLQLLYVGCGLGKMGPWFVGVFNQECTLPPWSVKWDLRKQLYQGDFPRDNTPSATGVALAYCAASAEWLGSLLLLCTSRVVGGEAGTMTVYVFVGLCTILAMHVYINIHMPLFDVWMLNFTAAYVVYNVYYRNPYIAEAGFDYDLFNDLHPVLQVFCWGMAAYCIFGQLFPEAMTYMHCYRFWAGNWPQAYVLMSAEGAKKVEDSLGVPVRAICAVVKEAMGEFWEFSNIGFLQPAQLSQRMLPLALHKALAHGAKDRGENAPRSLTEFHDNGGVIMDGPMLFGFGAGYHVNDALRGRYFIKEFQARCSFEPGEFQLVEAGSFPLFAGITGAKARWAIADASKGILEEGRCSPAEAMMVTRPSLLRSRACGYVPPQV